MPIVALVGCPNVGKSTLFNRLASTRDALVANRPGLTRDRQYARAEVHGRGVTLVDTGGLMGDEGALSELVSEQANAAIAEADVVALMVDARAGLTGGDEDIAQALRRRGADVLLVVNKVDGVAPEAVLGDFAGLGFGEPLLIAAAHGRGVGGLKDALAQRLKLAGEGEDEAAVDRAAGVPRVAIVGRPNVGKSTLVNRLLGATRQIVSDQPGTTRDAIEATFERRGRRYALIDTAGVRRRGKVSDFVEKFSIAKTLAALDRADVACILVDAQEGLVEQDLHIFSYAAAAGASLILAANKWDGLAADERASAKAGIERRMRFAPWAPVVYLSALRGAGMNRLLECVDAARAATEFEANPAMLTRLLTRATEAHPPPQVGRRPIKLRYARKGGIRPPTIMVHGNRTDAVPDSYVRYLENFYRDALTLVGAPVKIEFRVNANPYAGKRNVLTRRQRLHRRRVIERGR